jgi:IS30 family transposase
MDVAYAIGVHPSTIGRELKRNPNKDGYHASHADILAKQRRKESKKAFRKIENDRSLEKRIESFLNPLVSPEATAHEFGIAHQTIYDWIYRSRPELEKMLPYQGKKRRGYGKNRSLKQGWTRYVRTIDERPESKFSWEGDTVKGLTNPQLLTHVEQKSLFTIADIIENGTADAVQEKMKSKDMLKESIITYDRGSKFALWKMIGKDINVEIYFAHAHHPWERGKNENTNGRLRRVFPKRFDFSTVTQRDIDATV